MALAFVSATNGGSSASTTKTFSVDCTGADLLLVGVEGAVSNTNDVSGITYNGVSLTQIGTGVRIPADRYLSCWYLLGPATGTNNVVISGGSFIQGQASCWSGAKQSGQPDASSTGTANAGSTISTSLTVGTANSWELFFSGSAGGAITTGTGYTLRGTVNGGMQFADSNADLPTGSNAVTVNYTASSNHGVIYASFAPVPSGINYTLTATCGTYTLTGFAALFHRVINMVAVTGSYTLTGFAASFHRAYTLAATTGSYILTGFAANLLASVKWAYQSKNSSSYTNQSKNTSTFTNQSKNSNSWTNRSKS